ncbi:hypothetical protein B0I37DRAFT_173977 [Chaetomium sp. MPI-CAGE-AT-0009]|nr:hypothetical protein B0I37DRAFT_173977 [Chaetomium sp. MPI-CAGE-AT-0009]
MFLSPINAALAASFSAVWQTGLFVYLPSPVTLREALMTALTSSTFAFLLFQLLRMKGAKGEAQRWNAPGKVLLFPCRTSHTRLFPKKHSFSYSYLLVGIPVGFEGNAGGLVSVKANGKPGLFPYFSLAPWAGWFTVDAGDYLEHGNSELGLRGKLDEYLRSQGVDPAIYPSAYLITAPRFLGYQFNPVSFWYLYDADKRLAAMILEVNNTFSERRMYYLTACHGPTEQIDCPPSVKHEAEEGECPPDHSTHRPTFKQTWPKDFHVSPFNSRKGSYSLRASDPLNPSTQATTAIPTLTTTITLLSSKNHPKMIATLSSTSAPVDPHTLTPTQKYHFLARWWYVGLLTYPRILAQAAVLFFQHGLRVWGRPEPRLGTLSRPATRAERQLEAVFRSYLAHLVEVRCASPLVVRYAAAGGVPEPGVVWLRSPAAEVEAAGAVAVAAEELEVRVLTPAFYARFAAGYAGTLDALVGELGEGGTLWASRPDLLPLLVPGEITAPPVLAEFLGLGEDVPFRVLQYLRGGEGFGMSGMDAYVLECEDERERGRYKGHVLRVLLAEMIPFRSVALVEAIWLIARAGAAVLFLWAVLSVTVRW